jgi:hypothetical protein
MLSVPLPRSSPPSEPAKLPAGMGTSDSTPTPRSVCGCHQGSARPVLGSSAAIPLTSTAFASHTLLLPHSLLSHRLWPPTYTAEPVTATAYMESPPA